MRLQDSQRYEIIKFCVNYLFEKHPNEKGLFRSSVSQTDVRLLQTQIIQHTVSYRDEFDPHIISEVLQTTLRDLSSPLFLEVYKEVVATELVEDDYDLNKSLVQKWIAQIPDLKFEIANQLFRLLNRLAFMEENEASLMQLAYCISPSICRPLTSAYMSIRHMEDLKKIRPVTLFLIENHAEVFLVNRQQFQQSSRPQSVSSIESASSAMGFIGNDKTSMLSDMMQSAMVIDTTNTSGRGLSINTNVADAANSSNSFMKPNLLVMIPTGSNPASSASSLSGNDEMMDADYSTSNASGMNSLASSMNSLGGLGGLGTTLETKGGPYSDSDWKILYALVNNLSAVYLEFEEKETADFIANEASSDAHHVYMQSYAARLATIQAAQAATNAGNANAANANGSESSSGKSTQMPRGTAASTVTSHGRRMARRKMVGDCKTLRSQIHDFETEFTKKYQRMPKSHDRGNMSSVYNRYRELKREIRDGAAGDIQRVIRGYLSRTKFGGRILVRRNATDTRDPASIPSARSVPATNSWSSTGGSSSQGSKPGNNSAPSSSSKVVAGSNKTVQAKDSTVDDVTLREREDTFHKLREMLESKKELKKRLKKFDEDFQENHGRMPKKADKEVIRPMYQRYHEIKNSIESMRKVVIANNYPIPDDLAEELQILGSTTTSASSAANLKDGKKGSSSKDDLSDMESDDKPSSRSSGSKNYKYGLSDDEGDWGTKSSGGASFANSGSGSSDKNKNLDALLQEKKNLHAYLKVYERDFNRSHGRPVMKNEDILPVANEYQRYKELKNLIKDLKG